MQTLRYCLERQRYGLAAVDSPYLRSRGFGAIMGWQNCRGDIFRPRRNPRIGDCRRHLVSLWRRGEGPATAIEYAWLISLGQRGVDLFFVLSGFLDHGNFVRCQREGALLSQFLRAASAAAFFRCITVRSLACACHSRIESAISIGVPAGRGCSGVVMAVWGECLAGVSRLLVLGAAQPFLVAGD